jgi:hypothetical protein
MYGPTSDKKLASSYLSTYVRILNDRRASDPAGVLLGACAMNNEGLSID